MQSLRMLILLSFLSFGCFAAEKNQADTNKQEVSQQQKSQQNPTLYEKIKSGWNTFLNAIVPVDKQDNKN